MAAELSEELSVAEEIAWHNNVRTAKKLYEKSGQAPSPSKDYCQILVTTKGVAWRVWNITLRNTAHGWYPKPTEDIMTLADYEYDKTLQQKIEIVFGPECIEDIRQAIHAPIDPFSCLPIDLSIHVISCLDLQSINALSLVSRHFRELCSLDALWERLYVNHQGKPSGDVYVVARTIGWKKLYFMNKLQIQKEISRLRRNASSVNTNNEDRQPSSPNMDTFLTQQVED